MNENLAYFKATIVAALTAIGAFLGWKGVMLVILAVAMALDYISGTLAARKAGEWKSSVARDGLAHKGGMILVVLVALITDILLEVAMVNIPGVTLTWPGLFLPLVAAWYILTELGSILENAVKLGVKVPAWLLRFIDATIHVVDSAGEEALEGMGNEAAELISSTDPPEA